MKRRFFSAAAALLLAGQAGAQEQSTNSLEVLVRTLSKIENPAAQANILKGLNASLKGKRDVPAPQGWAELYEKLRTSPNKDVQQQAQALAAVFGGGAALDQMRATLASNEAAPEARKAALDSLVAARDAGALPLLIDLLKRPGQLRGPAIRGLAAYDDPQVAQLLVQSYASLDSADRQDALNTLLARPANARALLTAIDTGTIPRQAISAPLARQLQSFKSPEIEAWLAKNWGAVRGTSADKQAEIAKYKEFITNDLVLRADPTHGRAIFNQTCVVCHEMFGIGGKIGPHLTGAYEDIDYLLQNIVDPNAIIGKDYQQTFVELKDGQMISGIVASEDQSTIMLRTLGEPVTISRGDVKDVQVSPLSMMPEGLLTGVDEESVRDLFAYLRQRQQVPLLVTPANAGDFFSGSDLARWRSTGEAWKFESGAIIGRNPGAEPVSLTSEMVAADFVLTGKLRLSGLDALAEVVLRGVPATAGFTGTSLTFGGREAGNLWRYEGGQKKPVTTDAKVPLNEWVALEAAATGNKLVVKLNGQIAFEIDDSPGGGRSIIAFNLHGKGAELAVKDLKIEPQTAR
jgi:putative heme-binding domain-containing protein